MRSYLAGLLLLAPGLALAQTPAPTTYSYRIKGKLGRFNAPAKVYLLSGVEATDSATLRQGQFELKGSTPWPHSATLVLERQGRLRSGWREMKMPDGKMGRAFIESPDRIRLFLEPGPVVVTSPDSLRTARMTGGKLTTEYQQLLKATDFTAKFKTTKSPAQFTALNKEYQRAQRAFMQAYPASWVGLEVLGQMQMMGPLKYDEVAPLYAALTPAQQASPPGKFYGEMLLGLKNSALGAQAPAFTQQTPDGKAVSLADYRGKYVLVDFWASWCTPCRAENPAVRKAYEAFKGRNFEVLGVSLDEEKTRAAWVKAIADDQMPWAQVSDLRGFDSAVAQQYGVKSIPQNFLIDPSGKIVASNLRGEELLTTLARLIK